MTQNSLIRSNIEGSIDGVRTIGTVVELGLALGHEKVLALLVTKRPWLRRGR